MPADRPLRRRRARHIQRQPASPAPPASGNRSADHNIAVNADKGDGIYRPSRHLARVKDSFERQGKYQSRENAKHVLRAMKENARQGFYNGSRVPLGYAVEDVEKRGHRTKKRLVVDPVEAETVRLIFKLYLEGDEGRGPLGIKEIVKTLNARGVRTRLGARFLTNPIYIGEWRFNRRHAKTGREKPVTEIIAVEVAPIVERSAFEEVQRTLVARNPRTTPPRVTTGPILLMGLAHCASCGSAMTMRSGTSKTGRVIATIPAQQLHVWVKPPARVGQSQWTS